jgi:hypothetical protein
MKPMKRLIASLVLLLASTASVEAAEARGAMCDAGSRVTATAYYSSGNYHGVMDQAKSGGGCWTQDSASARYHRGSINSSRYYSYLGGCGKFCGNNLGSTCNGGAGNMITTTGSNGWDWRQMHINYLSGHSKSKTCTRCSFGLIGSTGNSSGGHAHVENRRYGTKSTSWMSGAYVGMASSCTQTVGSPKLQ